MIVSLFNVFDVAGSAMSAQTVRLNVVASNLANAESAAGDPNSVYRAREVVFQTMVDRFGDGVSRGVRVAGVVEQSAPPLEQYAPDHPLADEHGKIYLPNINPIAQMANMISAARAYQTNVELVKTSKEMMLNLMQLGQ